MGIITIRQTPTDARQAPWVAAIFVFFLVLFNELRNQLIRRRNVNRVARKLVGIINNDASAFALGTDTGRPEVGRLKVFRNDCLHNCFSFRRAEPPIELVNSISMLNIL